MFQPTIVPSRFILNSFAPLTDNLTAPITPPAPRPVPVVFHPIPCYRIDDRSSIIDHRLFDRCIVFYGINMWRLHGRSDEQEHASFVAPGAAPLPATVRTCPASLGVRCGGSGSGSGDDAGEDEDEATTIISKGCILPAQGTTTVKLGGRGDGGPPTEAYLEVVEIGQAAGEGAPPTARLLGTLAFDEAAVPADGGAVEVKVGFTLRSEGVLKVEAVAPGGASKVLVIGHDGAGSS